MTRITYYQSNGMKFEVSYNHKDQGYGKADDEMQSYIEVLAQSMVPIDIVDWRKAPDTIKKSYDKLIAENQDLFYYLNGLKDTIVAKGTHPSGIIGSPITLADNIGLFYKDGDSEMPVSICAMKAVDSLNYVKFDILGLKTVGIIKDACKYAGIPYPKSYELNWNDPKVWHNMITAQQGVFQFEGEQYCPR